jgi:hypothetical protein
MKRARKCEENARLPRVVGQHPPRSPNPRKMATCQLLVRRTHDRRPLVTATERVRQEKMPLGWLVDGERGNWSPAAIESSFRWCRRRILCCVNWRYALNWHGCEVARFAKWHDLRSGMAAQWLSCRVCRHECSGGVLSLRVGRRL